MVAKITSGKSIRGILHYNENKVREGMAECILSNRFSMDLNALTLNLKNEWFKLWIANAKGNFQTKAVHVSLNFHNTDRLNRARLKSIASSYMEKIGFGDQPFLVYQHFDVHTL